MESLSLRRRTMNKSSTSVTSVSHQARVSNGGQRGAEQEVATIFHSLAISSPRTHSHSKIWWKLQTSKPLSGTIKILSAFNICENFVCVFSFSSSQKGRRVLPVLHLHTFPGFPIWFVPLMSWKFCLIELLLVLRRMLRLKTENWWIYWNWLKNKCHKVPV